MRPRRPLEFSGLWSAPRCALSGGHEWFGVNLPPTLKTQRAVLARFRGDVEAMLCYEAADWATLPPHVRLDINARLSGYQEVCAVTDRERYWPNLDDAKWAVLSELEENLADLCFDASNHLWALEHVDRRGN